PREEKRLERREADVAAEERFQELARLRCQEGVEPDLVVIGFAAPVLPVLGSVVDEQHEPRRRQALDQTVERGLRLRVDPVEVFDDHEEWLGLALPQEESLQGVDGAPTSLRWGESFPCVVFHRYVEECEDRRQRRLEGAVEREELLRDLAPDGARLILV